MGYSTEALGPPFDQSYSAKEPYQPRSDRIGAKLLGERRLPQEQRNDEPGFQRSVHQRVGEGAGKSAWPGRLPLYSPCYATQPAPARMLRSRGGESCQPLGRLHRRDPLAARSRYTRGDPFRPALHKAGHDHLVGDARLSPHHALTQFTEDHLVNHLAVRRIFGHR
jgi:hypothetical protein